MCVCMMCSDVWWCVCVELRVSLHGGGEFMCVCVHSGGVCVQTVCVCTMEVCVCVCVWLEESLCVCACWRRVQVVCVCMV